MGTWCRVSVCHDRSLESQARGALEAAFLEMARVEACLSRFRQDSDLSLSCAGLLTSEGLSPLFRHVHRRARRMCRLTQGAFDAEHGQSLDLGGIGKGTAVDAAVRCLRASGFRDFLVDAGGDLHAAGRHAGSPWTVCLPLPHDASALALLALEDRSAATSGTEARGEHIVAREGATTRCVQVCVVGPSTEVADALATAAWAAGPQGCDFLRRFPAYEALLLDEDDRVHLTPGFRRYIRPLTRQHAELL